MYDSTRPIAIRPHARSDKAIHVIYPERDERGIKMVLACGVKAKGRKEGKEGRRKKGRKEGKKGKKGKKEGLTISAWNGRLDFKRALFAVWYKCVEPMMDARHADAPMKRNSRVW
jgi:hypothetical protein